MCKYVPDVVNELHGITETYLNHFDREDFLYRENEVETYWENWTDLLYLPSVVGNMQMQ